MVVNELSRLTQPQVADAVARLLADLDNGEYTDSGIEAVHRLRLWQSDYLRLAAELDTATRSFWLVEQRLRQQIDVALADWERRFESGRFAGGVPLSHTVGFASPAVRRRSSLRGLFRRGDAQPPPAVRQQPDLTLTNEFPPPSPESYDADITALVLGPFELTVSGSHVLRWTSLKARAIFQYLLIHQDRPVRRDVLMSLQWPNHSYNSARNNLNVALCSLRNTLDWRGVGAQAILHKEGCYLLNPALTCWIDRNEFLSKVREAQRARQADHPRQAIEASRLAIHLYRGPLFEDDSGADWYLPERRQLKELYLQALEYLGEASCESGQLMAAIEFGQQAISADPCYEPGHRLLMRCYAQQHQQQLVCRQYRLCAAALNDELDVSPAAETVQLFRFLTSAS